MTDLKTCLGPALRGGLVREPAGGDVQPVKIAILDKVAHFSGDFIGELYDEGFAKCCTWLESQDEGGKLLDRGSVDSEGHGTHATSVLLDATEGTGIHIFSCPGSSARERIRSSMMHSQRRELSRGSPR